MHMDIIHTQINKQMINKQCSSIHTSFPKDSENTMEKGAEVVRERGKDGLKQCLRAMRTVLLTRRSYGCLSKIKTVNILICCEEGLKVPSLVENL